MLLGVPSPRVALTPKHSGTRGDDCSFLSSAYGLTPDVAQQVVIDGWLAVKRDGRWAASRCGVAEPRQNGKNGIAEAVEFYKMVGLGRRILHTAHEVKTARKAFVRLSSFFENRQYPELMAMVKEIRRTNGQEAIVLTNGSSCEFIARSKGSGRGYTVDDLVCDEAQELSEDALAALLPTISAAPSGDPQLTMLGTPPAPSMDGEVWTRMRMAGVKGDDLRLAWYEWSCDGDVDLDDKANWAAANPAYGTRLNPQTIADERAAMDDTTFARERLGMWDEASSSRVIDSITWDNCADVESIPVDAFALAVGVNPDRSSASVAFAGQRADGLWHFELDEQRSGVGWVAGYIAERVRSNAGRIRAVVVNGSSPAKTVVDDLLAKRIKTTVMSANEVAESFGKFFDAVTEGTCRHTAQPQVNAALTVARKRDLAGGSAWSQKNSASDITPVEACTFALWGAQSSKVRRPGGRSSGGGREGTVL